VASLGSANARRDELPHASSERHLATLPVVDPADPHAYRISDADREGVAERLRHAAGEGRISIDELGQRLEETYAATTYGELVPITADLPERSEQPVQRPVPSSGAKAVRAGGAPTSSTSVAIFGGAQRKGLWVVPDTYTAFAMFGGVELDLREAQLAAGEVTINAVAIFGGVDIIAPLDVQVVCDGVGIMGGFDQTGDHASTPPPAGAPVVRVKGVAFMGGVSVKRKSGPRAQ